MRPRRAAALAVLGLLLATTAARADGPTAAPALQGVWVATNAGGAVFRGAWVAEVALATPNVALGTWTLVDDRGNTTLGGTWSARRAPRGWRGAWSARVGAGNDVLSGTWDADDSTLNGAKTFRDLLARTATKRIAGVWHLGRAHGNWWLEALPAPESVQ
jgi:hypothetical protein